MGIRGKSSRLSQARGKSTETRMTGVPQLVYDARRSKDPFPSLVYESMEGRRKPECQWEWSLEWKTDLAHWWTGSGEAEEECQSNQA